MKTFAVLFTAAALSLAAAAWEKSSYYTTYLGANGTTNNVAAGATNTYTGSPIAIQRYKQLGLSVKYTFTAAPIGSTPTVTLRLYAGVSQYEFATNPTFSLIASGATNTVVAVSNFVVGSYPFFRLAIENTNSAAITNVSLVYSQD